MTPKLVVATSFPVFPPRGGGQSRVFGLYSALARLGVEVDIVSLVGRGERADARSIAPGVYERRVPKTAEHDEAEYALSRRVGVPVTDVALALHAHLTPAYGAALREAARGASAAVASHPYAQPPLTEATALPLVYEAHNVESDLKASMYDDAELAEAVRAVEAACCATATHTIVCTHEDGDRLGELYGLAPERVVVVPNGVDPARVPYTDPSTRDEHKRALGLGDAYQALFLGSWHEPNLVAVRSIHVAAEQLPDVRFLVVGSAGLAFAGHAVPPNVDLCGVVEEGFVRGVLGLADVALNPMRLGSGTNLKMLDYALAGIPVLSTAFGARGLGLEPGRHYAPIEGDELAPALTTLRGEDREAVARRATLARDVVAGRFAWSAIAARWLGDPALAELLAGIAAPR